VGKIIFIKKGHRLSLQSHRWKHETVYTDHGTWLLLIGRRTRRMKAGDVAVIPPGTVHRFCAPYGNVRLLEVSTPQVKDVIRHQDDYGRAR
jgi:quercetin dioxygenase-like cupin family protein